LNVRNILELDSFTQLEKELLKAGMRSYVDIPLIVRGELMGILCLASNRPKAFDEKLQFIKEISDQLAIALHDAELFEMRIKSVERIEKNIEEFAILVDHIKNPLAIISGIAELEIENEKVRETIHNAVRKIEDVVSRLDKGWLESEEIREFLRSSREDNFPMNY
jgi:signal transduction protein with GAF and PtsI domain